MVAKHEPKKIWDFFFDINFNKTNFDKARDVLETHSFRNFKENQEMYDLRASVSLELDYNASKFAKTLLENYKWIKEIEVRAK